MQVASQGPQQKEQVCNTGGQKKVTRVKREPGQVHKNDGHGKRTDEGSLVQNEERASSPDGSKGRNGKINGKRHLRTLETQDTDVRPAERLREEDSRCS